jgi:pyruvate ferredoxin oxidoreductase delta subunit
MAKIDLTRKMGWKELPEGDVLEAGTAHEFRTGDWRSKRPVHDEEKCTSCLICWVYCPDSAIIVKDGKFAGIDLDHCKGCGICEKVCPPKVHAITMVDERDVKED